LEEEEPEGDEKQLAKLEEYAKLQIELDRKFGSLSFTQLFTVVVVLVLLVGFLGVIGEFFLFGSPFGVIFASILGALAVIGMSNGIRSSNIRKFLEDREEAREDEGNLAKPEE
jgi:hypothetical protein